MLNKNNSNIINKNNSNINFIFGLLDKKKILLCLFIKGILDFIYYVIPYTFVLFLTIPFTLDKAIMVAGIFILSKTLRAVLMYVQRKLFDNYLYDYSNVQYLEYYKKLTKIPVETLSKYQTGYLESIIDKISSLVKRILSAEYIGIILSFLFFFITAYKQSKLICLVAAILSALCITLSVKILKKSNKYIDDLYDKEYEYASKYQDFISNIRTVKALNDDKYFEGIIKKEGAECYKKEKKYVSCYSFEELVRNILIVIPFFLAIIKGVYDLSRGEDSLGIITFYISLYMEIGYIFDQISGTIISAFELRALKKKLLDLFKNVDERECIKRFKTIKLENVVLKHKEAKFDIRVDNFIVNKNDKISITGKSGQGKTSIINLILGNITSFKGDVMIDNESISKKRCDIGVVSKETELFNMTIKENLTLGKRISDDEIISLIKELELDELLMLECGINTIVGEKGLKLSTGQKRRINILRSYIMNKDIYILDEPTSNLDKHTEEIVVNFILNHFKDKTLIIATHNEKIKDICNKFYHFRDHKLEEVVID